jgi:hypothetical protein
MNDLLNLFISLREVDVVLVLDVVDTVVTAIIKVFV